MTAPAEAPAPGRAAFIFIFITLALDMLALGVIVPVLPRLIIELNHGTMANGALVYGVFGAVWQGTQFFFAPVIGAISDHFGRRRVILISTLGLGLDYFVMAAAPTLGWLFFGRIVSGITSASYSTAFAYISDVTPPEKRAGKFGMLGAAFGIGFVIGPALGGVLGNTNLRLPFIVAGALSLVGSVYGYFVLPESLPVERRVPFQWRSANPAASLKLLRGHRALLGLAAAAFIYRLAHDMAPNLFVIYGDYRYHWTPRDTGLILASIGVLTSLVQAFLVRPIVHDLGERKAMLLGFSAGATANLIFGLAAQQALYLVGIPFGAFFGLAFPSLQGLMTRRVGPDEQGRLQGAIASLGGFAGMLAPMLFTGVFALAIAPGQPAWLAGAPYFLATALLIAAIFVGSAAARAGAAADATTR